MIRRPDNRVWLLLGVAAGCALLDQLSKAIIEATFSLGSSASVTFFFNVVHVLNPGAAFSFLADAQGWQRLFLSVIAVIASVVLIILIVRKPSGMEAVAYALILGGAVGNLIDRGFRGAVVDWLDFYWRGMHWPAFNLADIWIVVGAALLVFTSFRSSGQGSLA